MGVTGGFFHWNGTAEGLSPGPRDVWWLGAWDSSIKDSSPVFFSHYFNLTKATETTTSSSSSATSTTTSTNTLQINNVPTTDATNANPTQTVTGAPAAAEPSSSPKSQNTVAIGAGVGGAIGGALLLAAAFWAFRYRKQQKQKALDAAMPPPPLFHDGYRDSHPQTYYVDPLKTEQFSPTAEMMDQGHQNHVRPELSG